MRRDSFMPFSCRRVAQLARAWGQDDRGATAIEFAMVGTPFFMFIFGIFGLGMYFFTTFSLENAVEQASRLIRVGLVQQSGMTAEEFKQEVCNKLPAFVDCDGKLRINVQSYSDFGSIAPPACETVLARHSRDPSARNDRAVAQRPLATATRILGACPMLSRKLSPYAEPPKESGAVCKLPAPQHRWTDRRTDTA